MRKSIIDIGTNTFNLLVIELTGPDTFYILYEEKLPVKLGKGSMNDGILKPDAIDRAVKAIKKHISTAHQYNSSEISAFATSAVRSAQNKDFFTACIKKECGIDIRIITGDQEAELIYKGVRNAIQMNPEEIYLILDIGGGSNEFIICNRQNILWKKSYNLGIARLLELIHPHDPLHENDITRLRTITDNLISELVEQCYQYKPKILLGASGSFETYVSMILHQKYNTDNLMKQKISMEIDMNDFFKLHDELISSTLEERLKMPGLPDWRADMIVLAAVFTKYIIEKFELNKIIFSDYSMKEGVVYDIISIGSK